MSKVKAFSGAMIDFKNVSESQFRLEDIEQGLHAMPRFCGHTQYRWTVAEHSMAMGLYAYRNGLGVHAARLALWHDAAEAYMSDIPKPLKDMLPQFKKIEKRVLDAILKHFGVAQDDELWAIVHKLDADMCEAEQYALGRLASKEAHRLTPDQHGLYSAIKRAALQQDRMNSFSSVEETLARKCGVEGLL